MTDQPKLPHHEINYIEITVPEVAAAKRFYGRAFGWEFNDYGPTYAGIKKQSGGEVGGFTEGERVTGGPLLVLFSQDLESSRNEVQQAGGKLTRDIFSFPGGRRFQFTDPFGNELAVWSY
ncbi:MAG: VOC family protein [Planctomycetota bacterium]